MLTMLSHSPNPKLLEQPLAATSPIAITTHWCQPWSGVCCSCPDGSYNGQSLILPSLQSLHKQDDFIPLPLPNVVNTDAARLDVVIQKKIEKFEYPFQSIIVRSARECTVRDV